MGRYIMTVRSNPVAGREAEFNDWYDRYLLPQMVGSPGLVSGQRFKVAAVELPAGMPKPQHQYLAVYEIETDDLQKTIQSLWSAENVARIPPSSALDYSTVDCQFYGPIGPVASGSPAG